MPIKCLIVDDEPLGVQGIVNCIQKLPELEVCGECSNAIDAIDFIKRNEVDLLFLDINMPEMTGLEMMKAFITPPPVIFTTAYREFAVEGFELNAIDYLVKPISLSRFVKAVEKYKKTIEGIESEEKDKGTVFIKCDGQIVRIHTNDILYIESAKDYVFIHTVQKRYMTLLSLKQLEGTLDHKQFARIHRSFIIAIDKVKKLEGHSVHIGNAQIPISRSLQDNVYKLIVGNRLLER